MQIFICVNGKKVVFLHAINDEADDRLHTVAI